MKNLPSRWKYGLVAVLAVLGISSAASYYAGASHSPIAQPKTTQTTSTEKQVKGAQSPTNTPVPELTATPTPSPTLTPPPTQVYIAPTTPYTPPTQTPASQTNGQLDNNNYYTNVDGNQVHSPANTDDGSVPAGATAQCGDGTYSFSQHHSGTCSHHGGVAQWL
jgi:Protein of unknown function (DUF3761)